MTENRQQKIRTLEALLVLDAKAGDRQAIEWLVTLRGDRLLAHAARLSGDREAAQDVVQEAWIQIIRGLPSLANEAAFLPWALCIVSRRVAAFIKARQKDRKISISLGPETQEAVHPSPEKALDVEKVRAALHHLPSAQHATIALFYLEDLGVADVAKAMDVPAGTVKTRLMKARSTLRKLLEGEQDG
ncbi:MAG: RNA polymerase sigma factor [Roseibium sp.]